MKEIIENCKCGVYLTVNKHKDMYQSAENAINELNEQRGSQEEPEIDEELKNRMIKEDSIYELQFYPDTPIGSYTVYGTSLEEIIGKASEILF